LYPAAQSWPPTTQPTPPAPKIITSKSGPRELKEKFSDWLRAHFPDRADKVLSLIRQSRDGQLNAAGFGVRMSGTGAYAQMLSKRFKAAARKLDLNQRKETPELNCDLFAPPPAPGDQLSLL